MTYDVIVVGGGIAGLVAASYVSKAGKSTLLIEKQEKTGGLVNSFEHNGYVFDGGIRATEDLGILFTMLNQLGIDVEFTENIVSIGVEDKVVNLEGEDSIYDYKRLLCELYPESEEDIENIISEIQKIMGYMDIQYGIENPVFKDIKNDRDYLLNTLLPWLVKYIKTIGKVNKLFTPVDEYLQSLTDNRALIDIIAQHFFQKTPAYFALSYFTLYLNYKYPVGGTGMLTKALNDYAVSNNAEIKIETEIVEIDVKNRVISDTKGEKYNYKQLIWAADKTSLYNISDISGLAASQKRKINQHKELLEGKRGGDSVFTLYIECSLPPEYFSKKHGSHMFYTPNKEGFGFVNIEGLKDNEDRFIEEPKHIFGCVKRYFKNTTYEIAIPVLRDKTLAPPNKSGLIISTLMDYSLVKHIKDIGLYDEFKSVCKNEIIKSLSASIYPELEENIDEQFSSTPITVENLTGNLHGAITGWAFTNDKVPAVSKLTSIAKSVYTELPCITQAGQWTFSPSGLPISIVTGKMAADRALKKLKKSF